MFLFALKRDDTGVFPFFQNFFVGFQYGHEHFGVLVAGGGSLLCFGELPFYGFEVFELQFGVDNLLVTHRVDGSVHVGDIVVVEAAQHMDDGISLPDVSEKFVSQSFAF